MKMKKEDDSIIFLLDPDENYSEEDLYYDNQELFDEPSRINHDPYGSWIMKVKLDDKNELKRLYNAEEKAKMLESGT